MDAEMRIVSCLSRQSIFCHVCLKNTVNEIKEIRNRFLHIGKVKVETNDCYPPTYAVDSAQYLLQHSYICF